MENIMENLKGKCFRESTECNYYKIRRLFNKFFIRLDIKPKTWKQRLLIYITYLIDSGRKSATIKSYISAIKAVLNTEGIHIDNNIFTLTAFVKACRLKNDFLHIRLPIQKPLFNYFNDKNKIYLRKLYLAALITGYYGLLCIGELTTGTHPVQIENVFIGHNKRKIQITLETSKMHTKAHYPQIIKILGRNISKYDRDARYCPFKLVTDYIKVHKEVCKKKGALFMFKDQITSITHQPQIVLKKAPRLCGIDESQFCFHSLRSGRACDLMHMGVLVETIKQIGHW